MADVTIEAEVDRILGLCRLRRPGVAGIIFAGGIAAVASTFIASKVTQGRLSRSQSPPPPPD